MLLLLGVTGNELTKSEAEAFSYSANTSSARFSCKLCTIDNNGGNSEGIFECQRERSSHCESRHAGPNHDGVCTHCGRCGDRGLCHLPVDGPGRRLAG